MIDIFNDDINTITSAIKNKDLSCRELVTDYFKKIDSRDNFINSYLYINKTQALQKAEEVDKKIKAKEKIGKLSGIPLAIKDNICTKDMPTTCGSKMLKDFISPFDATVVQKIEKEDGIILGKLNMDEFAMGTSTTTSHYKTTKNPFDIKKIPGGSSGASAAAVKSNETICSLGSDTGGSIRQPCAFCGTYGIKPSYGLVSRNGLIAYASSLDQIGPIAKNVQDLAFMLDIISGKDSFDSTTVNIEKTNFSETVYNPIENLKIGIPMDFFDKCIDKEIKDAIIQAGKNFEKLGATVDYVHIDNIEHSLSTYYIISCAEASSNLGRFDSIRYGYKTKNFSDLESLYKNTRSEGFGREVKKRIMFGTFVLSHKHYNSYYKNALKVRNLIKNSFSEIFQKYDLILMPVTPNLPPDIEEFKKSVNNIYNDKYTVAANLANLPALSMPCSYTKNNLPIGMQLIGDFLKDDLVLRAAYMYQQNYKDEYTLKVGDYID